MNEGSVKRDMSMPNIDTISVSQYHPKGERGNAKGKNKNKDKLCYLSLLSIQH